MFPFFVVFLSFLILLPYTHPLFLLRFCIKSGTFGTHVHGFRTLLHTDTYFEATKININTHFSLFFSLFFSFIGRSFPSNCRSSINLNDISSIGYWRVLVEILDKCCGGCRHVHSTS